MNSNTLPIAVALVALGASTIALLRAPTTPEPVAPASTPDLRELRKQFSDVQSRVSELEQQGRAQPARQPIDAASKALAPMQKQLQALRTRLETLEKRNAAEANAKPAPNDVALLRSALLRTKPLSPEEQKKQIQTERANATNASLDEETRLQALRRLRGMGKGARGGAVLDAMVQLAQTSREAKVRADVWRQMSGANDDKLVQPLIDAVLQDTDPKVREEAAETLADYLKHASVAQTLQHVKNNDADEGVRNEAADSLRRRKRR